MGGWGKVIVGLSAAAVAAALLVVLYANARSRANVSHCRRNLGHLGKIAVSNWQSLDPSLKGRAFWQNVREVTYKSIRGEWKTLEPDPFICPVYGKTLSRPADASAIDYRGPKAVRESLRDMPHAEPLGADRPGNHASGGHVLRLDTSVAEVQSWVDAASDAAWLQVDRTLTD